jgi:glycerol-3-phosphate cytidylyltransferase
MFRSDVPVVYTGGTFDLFHSGHVNLLQKCAELGRVVVALNSDEFILEYKKRAPIMSYAERKAVLEACRYVDEVVPNLAGADSKPSIEMVKPDIIAIGTDWARKDYHAQMQFDQDWLDDHEISLIYIPYTKGISTTELKRRSDNRNRHVTG